MVIDSRIFCCASESGPVFPDLRILRYPVIGVSGVASSCDRFCMNSVLLRAAARRRELAAVNSRTVASSRSTSDCEYSRK